MLDSKVPDMTSATLSSTAAAQTLDLGVGGMTGPERILDARDGGLYRAVADSFDMKILVNGLGTSYEILKIDKKPYPCCRTTHHAIDSIVIAHPNIDYDEKENLLIYFHPRR